jgi:hypothetical protein
MSGHVGYGRQPEGLERNIWRIAAPVVYLALILFYFLED